MSTFLDQTVEELKKVLVENYSMSSLQLSKNGLQYLTLLPDAAEDDSCSSDNGAAAHAWKDDHNQEEPEHIPAIKIQPSILFFRAKPQLFHSTVFK